MLKVFISNTVLLDVVLNAVAGSSTDNPYDVLYKILKSHKSTICVSEKLPDNPPYEIFEFLKSSDKSLDEKNTKFISGIPSNPSSVLKEPTGVFLLDVDTDEAKSIREKYGVICFAKEEAFKAGPMLLDDNKEYSTDIGEVFELGWETVLAGIKELPSNSLIISDRYLFSNINNSKGEGMKNLRQILQLLLPKKWSERKTGLRYHVLIVFDPEKLYGQETFQNIATKIISFVTSIRKYTIMVEVLGITEGMKDNDIYIKLHNRRIVSNYYIVKAEQQIAAFDDTRGTCCQTITPQRFFTEDSLVKATQSSSPQRSIRQLIEVFEDFDPNKRIGKNGFIAYYYCMATNKDDVKSTCKNLINRLLRKKKTIIESEI